MKVAKKEIKKKDSKKKIEAQQSKQDIEIGRVSQEIAAFKDKLTKLASTFDRELIERDKTMKQNQAGMWEEIQ